MSDQLVSGRRFRLLTIVDDFTRERVAIIVDTGMSGERVVRELEQLELPEVIASDNGPELTSRAVLA